MIRMKKKFLAGVASLALVATLGACGTEAKSNSGGSEAGVDSKDGKITLMVSTQTNPFFVDLREGSEEAAKAAGINLEVSDAQDDSATQNNQAQNAKASGVKVAIINPVDSDAAVPAVKDMQSGGIKVVAVDRGVTGVNVDSFIASDNVAGGKQAAEALAKAIGEEGEVIVLQGVPGTSASRDRGEGFDEGIMAYPKIKVVAKQTAGFDRAKGLDVATNLLQANPNVKGIFAENDEMALGAIQALRDKAGKEVKVVGFDGTADGLAAIESGTMLATIAQQPKELGKAAVEQALKLVKGESAEKTVPVEVRTVDKSNVGDFK